LTHLRKTEAFIFRPPERSTPLSRTLRASIARTTSRFFLLRPINYVYVLPAQTQDGVYPLGGDVRYLLSSDGSSITEKRQLHKAIIEIRPDSSPKGTRPAGGYHTHVLSDVPEDTDVFHVLTRKPPQPEYIGTKSKTMYIINTDGTIYEGAM
jgi:hypothetical protein